MVPKPKPINDLGPTTPHAPTMTVQPPKGIGSSRGGGADYVEKISERGLGESSVLFFGIVLSLGRGFSVQLAFDVHHVAGYLVKPAV